MGREKLSQEERRAIVLAFLSGTSAIDLGNRYDVARSWIYALADEAKACPREKLEESQAEAEFRRQVLTLL